MSERTPIEIAKDWCLRSAELEGDAEIGAGSLRVLADELENQVCFLTADRIVLREIARALLVELRGLVNDWQPEMEGARKAIKAAEEHGL